MPPIAFPTHAFVLTGADIRLRPLTEADWPWLLQWNTDPAVLYFSEGDPITAYRLDDLQELYRQVASAAHCFIIEHAGRPVGEGWLQRMNLDRILQRYPGYDCRRIDLLIGEPSLWGRGLGSQVIQVLTAFAFTDEHADWVFGCDIADYNPASLRAFQKAGYRMIGTNPQPAGSKARATYDVARAAPRV
jgi:RimJ/RimL family protein N-acetyltransferase